MSLEAITLVRTLPRRGIHLAPRDRFVLYALADFADDNLDAWPSHSTLVEWTGYTRSTVVEAIAALQEAGLISGRQRYRDDGSMTSKTYRINPSPPVRLPVPPVRQAVPPVREPDRPPVRQTDRALPADGHPPVREPDTMTHQIEPPENPQENQTPAGHELAVQHTAPTAPDPPQSFLDVWNQERGVLAPARSLNSTRRAAIARLKKEHGADALEMFRAAVRCVANDRFYQEHNHGLDALLKPGRVQTRAEQHAANGGLSAGDRRLAVTAAAIARAIGGRQ